MRIFEPVYAPYMELCGYGRTDWEIDPNPAIDASLASEYMERLAAESRFEGLRRLKSWVDDASSRILRRPR